MDITNCLCTERGAYAKNSQIKTITVELSDKGAVLGTKTNSKGS